MAHADYYEDKWCREFECCWQHFHWTGTYMEYRWQFCLGIVVSLRESWRRFIKNWALEKLTSCEGFAHLVWKSKRKVFSFGAVQFKRFCLPLETRCPPIENTNETASFFWSALYYIPLLADIVGMLINWTLPFSLLSHK